MSTEYTYLIARITIEPDQNASDQSRPDQAKNGANQLAVDGQALDGTAKAPTRLKVKAGALAEIIGRTGYPLYP